MAEIFLAKMTGYSGFEKHVALKKILPPYSQHPSFARMLIHEAKLAARIQHFNVVQVLDLGEIEGQVYIAMEYVRGRDLAALLSNTYRRKERLPLGVSLCVAIEFLTGLDYAHRLPGDDGNPLGLIHRDISPQNVLISFEGEVKLTDFGIARVISGESDVRLPGNLHGKFGYMSPEQVDGLRLDQRSDIFGAGVVLHEMLTGQRLFRGKTPQETVELVRVCDVQPPSATNPEVPHDIDRIVMKSLARDRDQRYQTVGAMLGELSRATGALPVRASRRDVAVYMKRQFGATVTDPSGRRSQVSTVSSASGRVPIGQILLHRLNAVTLDQIEIALAEQRANGGRLGEVLVENAVVTEDVLASALAIQSGLPLADVAALDGKPPSAELLARFPADSARSGAILPIGLVGSAATLAVADPYDNHAVLEAKIILGVSEARVVIASRARILDAIGRWYGAGAADITVEAPIEYQPRTSAPTLETVSATPSVLIADPDLAAAERLATRLREEGYEVQVAGDGKVARAMSREKLPTIAVIEVALPGIDGYNVLLDLRARELDCAVFLTSSRSDAFQETKALELGADDFIPKPWSDEVVTSKIRREVQKRGGKVRANTGVSSQFTGVSGSLADMTLLDIVQSLELGRKSAQVIINYEDGRGGELRVRRGELKGAEAGVSVADEAFYALVRPGPGVFRIEYREPTGADNITRPNTFLMLEALRRIDETDRGHFPLPSEGPPPPTAPSEWTSVAPPPPDPIEVVQQRRVDLARLVGDLEMDLDAPTVRVGPGSGPGAGSPRAKGPATPVVPAMPPLSRMPSASSLASPARPASPSYGVPAVATPARGVPAPTPSTPPMTPVPVLTPIPMLSPTLGPSAPLPPPPSLSPLQLPALPQLGRGGQIVPPSEASTEVGMRPQPGQAPRPLARVALQRLPTTAATRAPSPPRPGTPLPPSSENRPEDSVPTASDTTTPYPLDPQS